MYISGSQGQPTRPPLGFIAIYRDYLIKGLRLPLHPFIREVLLNLDISLPQLNPECSAVHGGIMGPLPYA